MVDLLNSQPWRFAAGEFEGFGLSAKGSLKLLGEYYTVPTGGFTLSLWRRDCLIRQLL